MKWGLSAQEAKLNQLRTVAKARLLRPAGQLSAERMLDIERIIKHSLGMVS